MAVLRAESRLQRAPGLRLRLNGPGRVEIELRDGHTLQLGDRALDVLSAFARPATFREGVSRLGPRAVGVADWIGLMETIRTMAQAGALLVDGAPALKINAGRPTFSGAPAHIRMLNDRVRTSRWIAALESVVRAGDIVVEVGTGTGVLAIAAARAGAKHVYTIESGAMAPVAREVVRANGVADRVTVVEGWSTEVTLPERGSVFVSETIGNLAFDENLIAIARDAVRRHLQPHARMIPQNLRLLALPVEAPSEWTRGQTFAPAATRVWGEWYDIDFDVLNSLPVDYRARGLRRPDHASWPVLGAAVPLASAEFAGSVHAELETNALATLSGAGELNAFVLFFESRLADAVSLSTDPRLPALESPASWQSPVWLVPPIDVRPGDQVRVAFSWQERGAHRWEVCGAAG
jgi:type I protein arginine methyltransferase